MVWKLQKKEFDQRLGAASIQNLVEIYNKAGTVLDA